MALEQKTISHKSGFYKHKETGIVVEINEIPGLGNPQADAFVQVGYEYVGTEDPNAKVTEVKK